MTVKSAAKEAQKVTYTKAQLLKSKRYESRRDLLTVLLEDDKSYSIAETDKKITTFMKGKVN